MATRGILLMACSACFCHPARGDVERPNILFVMIDDLGWMDLACQGNQLVETPRLDGLATEGMRFTSAYAAGPVCSPTRAAVMTGKSPARLRITNHIPDRDSFIPDNPVLLPAEMGDHLPLDAWHRSNRLGSAMRMGRYKLIERFDDGSLELYDLEADLGERNNLASAMPERAADMRAMLARWRDESGAAMPTRP